MRPTINLFIVHYRNSECNWRGCPVPTERCHWHQPTGSQFSSQSESNGSFIIRNDARLFTIHFTLHWTEIECILAECAAQNDAPRVHPFDRMIRWENKLLLRFKLHLHLQNPIHRRSHCALSNNMQICRYRGCGQCHEEWCCLRASQIKRRLINNFFAHYLWEKCQSHEIVQLLALNTRSTHHQWTASDAERQRNGQRHRDRCE